MFFVDLVSEQPIAPDGSKTRILGGIFPLSGMTWFFKMMGPDQLVESQRDAFKQFLQSVNVTGGGVASTAVEPPMGAKHGHEHERAHSVHDGCAGQRAGAIYATAELAGETALPDARREFQCRGAPNGKQVDVSVVSLAGMAGRRSGERESLARSGEAWADR